MNKIAEVCDVCDVCDSDIDWDARRSDSARIGSLEAGDFFHAKGNTRGGLICLTVSVTEKTITARLVPSAAFVCHFDRVTGHRLPDESYAPEDGACTIDCVVPLPPAVHHRLLDMDRRGRLRPLEHSLPGQQPKNWRATLIAYEHYAANASNGAAAGDSNEQDR